MATKLDTASHLLWKQLDKGPPTVDGWAYCRECGCAGNCECGHRPLAEPEHWCELDVNDDDESGRCYCCRAVERDNKEDNG